MRPSRPGATIAMSRAGRSTSRFIARSSGGAPVGAEQFGQRAQAAAGGEQRDGGLEVVLAPGQQIPDAGAGDALAVLERREDLRVVAEPRAGLQRTERDRPVQPVGVTHLVVVPDRAAGQSALGDAGKETTCGRRRLETRRRQVEFRRHVAIAVTADQVVGRESRADGPSRSLRETVGPDEEGQRAHEVRRDPCPGAALVDLLARLPELRAFDRPQAAVNRALMIERQAGAEVRAIHERDRQPAQGRVVCREEAMNPAPDDQQVVASDGQVSCASRHDVSSHL